jgi:6-phosphogluconolactonase
VSDAGTRWHLYANADALHARAARIIARAAHEAVAEHGAFHVVLAGGGTPQAVYRCLCGMDAAWFAWHVYFGDERCLPSDHPERNDKMARDALLEHVAIPSEQIHSMRAEQGAQAAARAYESVLRGIDRFDLVLLGLGEDGHTASLFPGHDWGTDATAPAVLPVHGAPKRPSDRVSLSAARLRAARQVLFLVTGTAKRVAVGQWRAGADIPARAIAPAAGVDVLVEAASFG